MHGFLTLVKVVTSLGKILAQKTVTSNAYGMESKMEISPNLAPKPFLIFMGQYTTIIEYIITNS